MRAITILALIAVLSVALVSGCTQTPSGTVTGNAPDKTTEDLAASALESELDQAIANMSESDIENALLNQ